MKVIFQIHNLDSLAHKTAYKRYTSWKKVGNGCRIGHFVSSIRAARLCALLNTFQINEYSHSLYFNVTYFNMLFVHY